MRETQRLAGLHYAIASGSGISRPRVLQSSTKRAARCTWPAANMKLEGCSLVARRAKQKQTIVAATPRQAKEKPSQQQEQQPKTPTAKSSAATANQTQRDPKKTCTTLLCELTRLKMQQKYLECNQTKLNAEHFLDEESADDAEQSAKLPNSPSTTTTKKTPTPTTPKAAKPHSYDNTTVSNNHLRKAISEIDLLKTQHGEHYNLYRKDAHREIETMWIFVNNIREDLLQPERLRQFPLQYIRERIVAVSAQLERLKSKNEKQLQELQAQYHALEEDSESWTKWMRIK